MHEESIYEKGNGKNRGIDPLHKVVTKLSNIWTLLKRGDPPMVSFTGSVLSLCNSFYRTETYLRSGLGGRLLAPWCCNTAGRMSLLTICLAEKEGIVCKQL